MSIIDFLESNNIPYNKDVYLATITGMSVEGTIPLVARPNCISQLYALYVFVLSHRVSHEIIGGLTNTYLCSHFTRDLVIQTTNVKDLLIKDNELEVGCGYSLTKLSRDLSQKGIAGYEGFIGIPGTVGAAAINNSGAFDSVMSSVVKCVRIITAEGSERILSNKDLCYTSRNSILKKRHFGLLLSVTLDMSRHGDLQTINKRIERFSLIRKRDIDGKRKSLGSIVTGDTIHIIWKENKVSNILRRFIYLPFKKTRFRKKMQCVSEFIALGGARFIKHCDNLGRFCWSRETEESIFFDYLKFLKRKSNDKVVFEIEIKK